MRSTIERASATEPAPAYAATPLERLLLRLRETYRQVDDGSVADYIPELSKADPNWFGISVVSLDGHEYCAGDVDVHFTIQSISKPFVYGLALEDHGEEFVLSRVGVEPSGEAFNAISLDPGTGVPSNPMINAGAITTSAMVRPGDSDPFTRVLDMFGRYTGRAMDLDEAVYRSESETGHRNRAIGHLLRNFEIIPEDPEGALDLYFRQCSVSVTCRDLAVMAACLANGGVNPVTGERAVEGRHVESILSVMGSCGMYDYAGEWIYRVGMPAKSGVSGGVLAVLPGQLGIGVFSPRLDARGNSVRGVSVCADLSRSYGLHMLSVPNLAHSAVRVSYDATAVRSRRQRPLSAAQALSASGGRVRVYELQGDLVFAAVEAFARQVAPAVDALDMLVIDFKHCSRIGEGGLALMLDLLGGLLSAGKRIALSNTTRLPELLAAATSLATDRPGLVLFLDRDLALEWCEDRLLDATRPATLGGPLPVSDNELCAGLSAEAVAALERTAHTVRFDVGETIVRSGDSGDSVYLVLQGDVSVTIDLPNGGCARVATLSAGMVFGEMAMLGENVRSANVRADTEVVCAVLKIDDLARLGAADPSLRAALYENLARKLAGNLRRANAEVRALSG
jgi:glutaminase